jgi:hypothetical protein
MGYGTYPPLRKLLEAVRTVRAPLAKFYALLNDEQKARFNALSAGEDQNEPERRRSLSVLCSERASGISSVLIRRVELTVRPDEGQRCHGAAARHHAARDQYRATCSAKILRLTLWRGEGSFGFEFQGRCSAFTSWRARERDPKTFSLAAHNQELVLGHVTFVL